MAAVLRWSEPVLHMAAGDGSWRPSAELHNPTNAPTEAKGSKVARGELLHPDGSRVTSRQPQPWPMPAMLRIERLGPGESRQIDVGMSLMRDELAVLAPGRYRLANVRWGELTAPNIDVLIASLDG